MVSNIGSSTELTFTGAVAAKHRGEHDVSGIDADDTVGERERHVARLPPPACAAIAGSAQMP